MNREMTILAERLDRMGDYDLADEMDRLAAYWDQEPQQAPQQGPTGTEQALAYGIPALGTGAVGYGAYRAMGGDPGGAAQGRRIRRTPANPLVDSSPMTDASPEEIAAARNNSPGMKKVRQIGTNLSPQDRARGIEMMSDWTTNNPGSTAFPQAPRNTNWFQRLMQSIKGIAPDAGKAIAKAI